jgi:hypothetical protein
MGARILLGKAEQHVDRTPSIRLKVVMSYGQTQNGKTMNQDEFEVRLKGSHKAAGLILNWLNDGGYESTLIPSTISPSYEERWQHVDDGDIHTSIRGKEYRIEVKGISTAFTSIESFPHPAIIVDEEYKIHKGHPLPLWGYAIVNKQLSGFIAVPVVTKGNWFTEKRYDKYQKRDCRFVKCPVNKLKYYRLR